MNNNSTIILIVVIILFFIWWTCQSQKKSNNEGFTVTEFDTYFPTVSNAPHMSSSLNEYQNNVSGIPSENSQEYRWNIVDNALFNAVYRHTFPYTITGNNEI